MFVEQQHRLRPLPPENSRELLRRMKQAGLAPTYQETPGAHTWFVWRRYLSEFAPKLFR
jgi:enterochelin esterase family protein